MSYQNPPLAVMYSSTSTKALTDLVKMYHDDTYKFGGDLYDILDEKIKYFEDLCRKAGVGYDLYKAAFSTILKSRTQKFFFDYLAETAYTYEKMVELMRRFFHTEENKQLYQNEFRSTTIHTIMRDNPGKDLPTCVEILIERIQRIHKGLSINYSHDCNLRE
ncbi:hypothetical protein GGR54DRAFT_654384 [Hypoxylon sp. NC1633]|nr:hypothetical protein GGR54DRAFT_654384 [Hypoxylon sp. NC1633]